MILLDLQDGPWHWGKMRQQATAFLAILHQPATQCSQAWTLHLGTTLHLSTAPAAATALHPKLPDVNSCSNYDNGLGVCCLDAGPYTVSELEVGKPFGKAVSTRQYPVDKRMSSVNTNQSPNSRTCPLDTDSFTNGPAKCKGYSELSTVPTLLSLCVQAHNLVMA